MKVKNISVLFIITALFLGFSTFDLASASATNGTSMMNTSPVSSAINGAPMMNTNPVSSSTVNGTSITNANPVSSATNVAPMMTGPVSTSSNANSNNCSTGVMNSQGLCSQPTVDSQSGIISQGGILASNQIVKPVNPNTYWCKPGTTDSNLCTNTALSQSQAALAVNSQGGILAQGVNANSSNVSAMNPSQNTQFNNLQGINTNYFGGMISPNSLGFFTDPNSVCSTGAAMASQGLCVNSQGLQGYYSTANCNFGIDPATNQCYRTTSPASMSSQAGILALGNNQMANPSMSSTNPSMSSTNPSMSSTNPSMSSTGN